MTILTKKTLEAWKQTQFQKQGGKCQICGDKLESWNAAHGDHLHSCGNMRGLLCRGCNTYIEGKIQGLFYRAGHKNKNWSDVLRSLADYWDTDYSANPIHPNFVRDESKKFGKLTKEKMITALVKEGVDVDKTYSKDDLIEIYKAEYRKILTH
ncbi:phage endonuclease [Buttiauxella gaviniae ATCC 51604]|uniref:Phage endonuclease n=1 Tax=Buttiauxella gaviniae ATCC 51604 TaxID=1354253 RepID=A0A1B7HN72_9ENTR|nr:endonuclease domain-containing protein [Buttiauxella gaviniae]OAT17068.1 phage endonuclease [Buttiauxella gaviniae ATCC 51604]